MTSSQNSQHLRSLAALKGVSVDTIVLPKQAFARLGGRRFRYLDWCSGGSEPILFLHGGAQTAHTWDVCCLAMGDRYRRIALEQRGHGDSDWSAASEYSIAAHCADIERFVDHLGLPRLAIAGMSMGGINALAYAARNPSRVSALMVIDVAPDIQYAGAKRAIHSAGNGRSTFKSLDEAVEHALASRPDRDPALLRASLQRNLRQLATNEWSWKYDRRMFSETGVDAILAERRPLWDEIGNIAAPTLIVRGALSDVLFAEDSERLARALPRARQITIENAGHSVQGDNPKALAAAIMDFLDSVGAVRSAPMIAF